MVLTKKKLAETFLSQMIVSKKEVFSKRGKLTLGNEFKEFRQRNVSLLVKLVKLYLDHSRLWISQKSLRIVNFITSGSTRKLFIVHEDIDATHIVPFSARR